VAECRTIPRDESVETGCSRSVIYVGALPMRDRCTRRGYNGYISNNYNYDTFVEHHSAIASAEALAVQIT